MMHKGRMVGPVPKWAKDTQYHWNQLAEVNGHVYAANGEFISTDPPSGTGVNIVDGWWGTWDYFAEMWRPASKESGVL